VTYDKCSGCSVHKGFYQGWLDLSASIKGHIQVLFNKYPTAALYITGHSLGGAIAAGAAPDIKATFGKVSNFYTFGAPRLGNPAHAAWFSTYISQPHRVIHNADIVPHLPTQSMDFSQFNFELWYTEDMKTYATCNAEDPKCSNSIPAILLSTTDHNLSEYLKMAVAIE
jgi:hypothetical protein